MNLLPKTHREFAHADFWNGFFKKRGERAFEWYGEYMHLCVHIHKYIKPNDRILMLGCGNSNLSMDMYDAGFKDITNIDISPVVIKNMLDLNAINRADMKFILMDATAMSFENEQFSVAVDKGTLDALFVDNTEDVRKNVESYFKEIIRTMRNGGRYLCISLLQEHILQYVLDFFPRNSYMLRIVNCERIECDENPSALPVFLIVATKFKALPTPIFEFSLGNNKLQRVTEAELRNAVLSIQKAALICNGLARSNIAGNEVSLDLYKPDDKDPRYTVHILDQLPSRVLGPYAAFIVPQGREIEWLFSTQDGRKKLQQSAKYQRLAIVSLHRDQIFESLDAVKAELSESVKNLAPYGYKEQIPFLSLGSDVGKRETLICGFSKISGDFRIEEVQGGDGRIFRRLIFLRNQFVIQSEALIKIIKPKGKKERKKIVVGYLACQHHLYMSIGVQLAASRTPPTAIERDILIVGLGGGGLCTFLHEALTNIRITAVDIDPIMLEVAEQFFELKQGKRMHCVIDDGIRFLDRCRLEGIHFSAVLFDVDSKDTTFGMSCPPPAFVAMNMLEKVKFIIGEKGIFILNLVCRDLMIRQKTLSDLQKVFPSVSSYKLSEELNEVIFCSNDEQLKSIIDWKNALETAGHELNLAARQRKLSVPADSEVVDVIEFINDLKIHD